MPIEAGRENSERPTRSQTDLRAPKWLARIVEALVPPQLGSPNELIGVLLETHGCIAQAVLHIPVAIAPPALGRARDAFYSTISERLRPRSAFGTFASEEIKSNLVTSCASVLCVEASMISDTDWPADAMSWLMALSSVGLISMISATVSRSFRSRSCAWIKGTLPARPSFS